MRMLSALCKWAHYYRMNSESRTAFALLGQTIKRPHLLFPLLAVGWRFRRRDWYRHWPFLPVPPADYVAWRLHTAFGDEHTLPTLDQTEAYVRWARRMPR